MYNYIYDLTIEIDYIFNYINNIDNDYSSDSDSDDTISITSDDSILDYEFTYINYNNRFNNYNEINNKLGKSIYIKKNDNHINQNCSICLDNLNYKQYKRILPNCNHYFHKKCIDKWLLKNSNCPICRINYK